ncbi:MAG: methyl-accepting chemotaxis protein [Treponema sp.]|nr:methyl-accepting chemotaxis protein [Treponema sp.]MCL2251289.1 methyl-accepting chemotaxis protein [Treponema sp.]
MSNRKKKTSFAAVFTSVVLTIMVFLVIALMLIFVNYLRSMTYKQTELLVSERIYHLKEKMEETFLKYEAVLIDTAYSISALMNENISSSELAHYLTNITARFPEMEILYFFNNNKWNSPNGFYASSHNFIPADNWDNTDRPWYLNAKNAKGKIAFSEPYIDANTGDNIISISIAVYDNDKKEIGVAAADVLVSELTALIKNNMIMPHQEIFLLNKDGIYITNNDKSAIMRKNFFNDYNLEKYQKDISSSLISFLEKELFVFSANIPAAGWMLVSVIPRTVIFAEINIFIMRLIFIIFVILAGIIFVTAFLAYRMLTIPIRGILKMTDAIAGMDFSVEIDEFRDDEIGDIQFSLMKIRDSLKTNIDSLQEHLSGIIKEK